MLPDELAGQYIEAAVQVLEAEAVSIPVKASAIQATKGLVFFLRQIICTYGIIDS